MRIDFFIDSMGPGGAERVTSLLVNWWASQGHDVRLVTLADVGDDHYSLEPTIDRVSIGFLGPARSGAHGLGLNIRRIASIRRLLRTDPPDAVVSFASRMNVLVLVSAWMSGEPRVIVSERSNPGVHPVPSLINRARRRFYRRAAVVVAQTEGAGAWIATNCPGSNIEVIPNPVTDLPLVEESDPNLVVAAGRLGPEKGFDLLLDAIAEVSQRLPDIRLRIYGEGPLRSELEAQVRALGLEGIVDLPGLYDDVGSAIGGAAAFVLSSRYEGFPNVLLEAMTLGTPVIAFACPHGPSEVIKDSRDGIIVPAGNVAALASSIVDVLADPSLRMSMRRRSVRVAQELSVGRIGGKWDAVLVDRAAIESPPGG